MAKIIEKSLNSWDEFVEALDQLEVERTAKAAANGRSMCNPLFRGLGSSEWALQTTLERSVDASAAETLLSYYRRIARSKPVVESLTNRSWDQIPEWPEFEMIVQQGNASWLDRILSKNLAIYQYLIYLRHHGFRSPFLDWTASPYVAAVFAFDSMEKSTQSAAVYAYVRDSAQSYGSVAHLFTIGPYLRTHPRHYLQQSSYSLCVKLKVEQNGDHKHFDYEFLSHTDVLIKSANDDLIWKIIIPGTERTKALIGLDSMNLNPYSLYGFEESLIRTVARREMLFNP